MMGRKFPEPIGNVHPLTPMICAHVYRQLGLDPGPAEPEGQEPDVPAAVAGADFLFTVMDPKTIRYRRSTAEPTSRDEIARAREQIASEGFPRPLVVWDSTLLGCGHALLRAARSLKLDKVPCIVVPGLIRREHRWLMKALAALDTRSRWTIEDLRAEIDCIAMQEEVYGLNLSRDCKLDPQMSELLGDGSCENDDENSSPKMQWPGECGSQFHCAELDPNIYPMSPLVHEQLCYGFGCAHEADPSDLWSPPYIFALPSMDLSKIDVESILLGEPQAPRIARDDIDRAREEISNDSGFKPPVIDWRNRVFEGDGRVRAARELGLRRIWCVQVVNPDPMLRRLFREAIENIGDQDGWKITDLMSEIRRLLMRSVEPAAHRSDQPALDELGCWAFSEECAESSSSARRLRLVPKLHPSPLETGSPCSRAKRKRKRWQGKYPRPVGNVLPMNQTISLNIRRHFEGSPKAVRLTEAQPKSVEHILRWHIRATTLPPFAVEVPPAKTGTATSKEIAEAIDDIRTHGVRKPVVIGHSWVLVAGLARLEAARSLRLEEIPIVRVPFDNSPGKRFVRLALEAMEKRESWTLDDLMAELARWLL